MPEDNQESGRTHSGNRRRSHHKGRDRRRGPGNRRNSRSQASYRREEKARLSLFHSGFTDNLHSDLESGDYVVFDIETTGGNPARNGITEIFAMRVRGREVQDTFYTLVDPLMKIPPIVRRMTGITNQMVRGAPTVDQVMPKLVEFVGEDILVSHNTIGDMRFLRHFSEKHLGQMMENYFLCTHLLTEKLIPEAPDKSLQGLGEYLNLEFSGQLHRAEADAYLTLELFKNLLDRFKEERITTIIDGIRFQGDQESAMRLGWGLEDQELEKLPNSPGVLYLKDRRNEVVFLTSTRDLARELSALGNFSKLPKLLSKQVLQAHSVDYEPARGLYHASILEAQALSQLGDALRYSPADWHQRVANFLCFRQDPQSGEHRLSIGPLQEGVFLAFGPIKNSHACYKLYEAISGCLGRKPHRKGIGLNPQESKLCRALLLGSLRQRLPRLRHWPKLFFSSHRQQWLQTRSLIRSLMDLEIPFQVDRVRLQLGILAVRQTEVWELFGVVAGIPHNLGTYPGELSPTEIRSEARSHLNGLAKLQREADYSLMAEEEAAMLNRIFWWVMQDTKRRDVYFYSKDELGRA